MSFTISQPVARREFYPYIGVEMQEETVTKDVTYTAVRVNVISESKATASFAVEIDGCFIKGSLDFTFEYSGSGNPIDEAEDALKASLN